MDDLMPVAFLGVVFSVVNAVVIIYLAMKAGMAVGLEVLFLVLAFFLFAMLDKVKPGNFLILSAIVCGSTAVAASYIDGMGAIMLSHRILFVPDYVIVVLLALSGVIGVLMSYLFMDYFMKTDFPWPGSKVNASIIRMLAGGNNGDDFKRSSTRMGISGILSGLVVSLKSFGLRPETIGSINMGISTSPMFIGVGMLVGPRTCIQIAGGALFSLLVWVLVEGSSVDYFTHMKSPWIFSTAISMLVATAVITLYVIIKSSFASLKYKAGVSRDGGVIEHYGNSWLKVDMKTVALAAAILVAGSIFWIFLQAPIWVFLLCILMSVLFMVIEGRGRAETSMSAGVSSFVILLVAGLAFSDIVPLLVLEGFVLSAILSFCGSLSMRKVAEYIGVPARGLTPALVFGAVIGAMICVPCLRLLDRMYGIGTEALPAPYSVMWLEMAQSAVSRVIPASVDPFFIIAGIIAAAILYRYRLSAISIAIGLILPVSTSATILIGGIIVWYLAKKGTLKGHNGEIASGIIAGDVIVSLLLTLASI